MKVRWSASVLFIAIAVLNLASGVDCSTAAKEAQKVYMDVLTSQGNLEELRKIEQASKKDLEGAEKELRRLKETLDENGKCNSDKNDKSYNVTFKAAQKIGEEERKKQLIQLEEHRNSLEKQINSFNDKLKNLRKRKEELTTEARNLKEEGSALEDAAKSTKAIYDQFGGKGSDQDSKLKESMEAARAKLNEHITNENGNRASLMKVKKQIAEISVAMSISVKKQEELKATIEADLARLVMLENHATVEKERKNFISQQKKECELRQSDIENLIREKDNEIKTAKKVVRMNEAKTRFMQKKVTEEMKKLDDLRAKEEKEKEKQLQ